MKGSTSLSFDKNHLHPQSEPEDNSRLYKREKERNKRGRKAGRKKSGGQTLGAIEDEWWQQTVAVTRKEREKKRGRGVMDRDRAEN